MNSLKNVQKNDSMPLLPTPSAWWISPNGLKAPPALAPMTMLMHPSAMNVDWSAPPPG